MDHRTQAFRAASHLPPVSVCLLLAVASLILLCSRTETSGGTKALDETSVASAMSGREVGPTADSGPAEGAETPPASPEELRIWTWLHQADALHKAGRSEEALGTLRRAEDLADDRGAPQDVRVAIQRGLAENLGATGRHDEAVEIWWRLLSLSSKHEDVAHGLASSLYASGRLEEARRVYREILHAEFEPEPGSEPGSEPEPEPEPET